MQATNRSRMMSMFTLLAAAFTIRNITASKSDANAFAYHHAIMGGGNGEFHPRKHPIMSYRAQQRNAKKRRRAR